MDEFHCLVSAFEGGALQPHVDSTFPLDQVPAAFDRLEHPDRRGKIVISVA